MPSVLRKQVVILDISMGHPTDHTEITKRGGKRCFLQEGCMPVVKSRTMPIFRFA